MNDAQPSTLAGLTPDDPRVAEILDIIAAETGVPRTSLTSGASIEALGIPSLDMVQAVFALETRFDIEIPVVAERSGPGEFDTVGDLVAQVIATIDRQKSMGDRQEPVGDRQKPVV